MLATTALGAKQKIIPCARGFGTENGCGSCDHSQAITLGSWDNATPSKNIHLEEVGSNTSGGYDIWWSIEQPQRGCRTLLFEPYSTDRGSLNPKLKGNVVLSVAHGGCYFTNLGHRGLLAGTCCNDDCVTAGGKTSSQRKRRSVSPRQWSNSNPFEKPSNNEEAPKPKTTVRVYNSHAISQPMFSTLTSLLSARKLLEEVIHTPKQAHKWSMARC